MREADIDVKPAVWHEWILEAIRKIRIQKQRPSIQRICQAIGSHHKFHEDIVAAKLEEAVASGAVIKVYNKGLHSYRAPMTRRRIDVSQDSDLSRLVTRAVCELGQCEGSSLKSIESFVQKSNNIQLASETDFSLVVKNSVKLALSKDYLVQEGKLFKIGKVSYNKRRSDSPKKKLKDEGSAESVRFYCVFFLLLLFIYL